MSTTTSTIETKRTDLFKINPKDLIIKTETNPREDYGTKEEWEEFKNSIKAEGVKSPVYITKTDEGYVLTHGFRRLRAVLELINEGVDIKEVPFLKVKNNAEQILLDHMTLNSGKPLTDLEKGETLLQLKKYGYTAKELSAKSGMSYIKVTTLLKFVEDATKETKELVKQGKASMTAVVEIVRKAKGDTTKQKEILEKATTSTTEGTKIKVKAVSDKQVKSEESYKKLQMLSNKLKYEKEIDKKKHDLLNVMISFITGEVSDVNIEKYFK